METNRLKAEDGRFYVGNLINDTKLQETVGEQCYDIAVANILAEVKDAIESNGMRVLEINHDGEWVNITAIKE